MRQGEGAQASRDPAQLACGGAGKAVPLPASEPLEVDAVAEEAVERPRRDDAGDVAVAEPELEHRRSERRGLCNRGRLRRGVVEARELLDRGPVRDRDAA